MKEDSKPLLRNIDTRLLVSVMGKSRSKTGRIRICDLASLLVMQRSVVRANLLYDRVLAS